MSNNFLLGKGERLMDSIVHNSGGGAKNHPYTLEECRERLYPQLVKSIESLTHLPVLARPNNFITMKFILHPAYLAKSYFPASFFDFYNLKVLGSKEDLIQPQKWTPTNQDKLSNTLSVYVAGQEDKFDFLLQSINNYPVHNELMYFEQISTIEEAEKLKDLSDSIEQNTACEVVLHASKRQPDQFIIDGFRTYLESLDIDFDLSKRNTIGGLTFVPIKIKNNDQKELFQYSFLRVLRRMPKLRMAEINTNDSFQITLPSEIHPLSTSFRASIIDGGYLPNNNLRSLVTVKNVDTSKTSNQSEQHGTMVTSSFLFGPIFEGQPVSQPPSGVDCWPVFSRNDDYELFTTLENVKRALLESNNELVNLSLGPRIPIDDDEVNNWTATIDAILARGNHLLTVAVGNDGNRDAEMQLNRIQPPSDCVNALSIGSYKNTRKSFARAPYSCIGKGRSPGVVKPDLVEFGGGAEPFNVLDGSQAGFVVPGEGTSFSAPYALRKAAIIKATLLEEITPIGLKALLIHNSEKSSNHSIEELGWGRLPSDILEILTTEDNQVTVMYQGELVPKRYFKVPIPLTETTKALGGSLKIKATLAFFTETDPAHPFSYTRSGVELGLYKGYRQNDEGETVPDRYDFFKSTNYKSSEQDLRTSFAKWENVIKQEKKINDVAKLEDPFFILHYVPRFENHDCNPQENLKFSFIITMESKVDTHLYNHTVSEYRMLEPIQLREELQLTT